MSLARNTELYQELASSLATSSGEQRRNWAKRIIQSNIRVRELSELLRSNRQTASRFLWLLSDVGIQSPPTLLSELPFLFKLIENLDADFRSSLASFWMYAGVPAEDEGRAIDVLFSLFLSGSTNVTIKSRALVVLSRLAKKYPDLGNELKTCITEQADKHSAEFRKRCKRILLELEKLPGTNNE